MPDNHEGKILENWLSVNKMTFAELADKIKVSRQSVYLQAEKEIISNSFKLKLRKAEINIFDKQNLTTETTHSIYDLLEVIASKNEIIKSKDHIIELQQQLIAISGKPIKHKARANADT